MDKRKRDKNFDITTFSYLAAGIFFVLLFVGCLGIFYAMAYEAYVDVLNFMRIIGYITAFASAILVCFRYATANKLKNPDGFIPPRDMFYYLKRMGFIVLMLVLMNTACSMGVFWISSFGSYMLDQIDDLFTRELIVKLPFFAIYLAVVYSMFQKFGFMDSQKKIYNMNFKILTLMVTFTTMVPGVIHDSFIAMHAVEKLNLNIWTVFGPHNGLYTVKVDGRPVLNETFGGSDVLWIIFTVLVTFAAAVWVMWLAYRRGKRRFIKDYLTKPDEYITDEYV